MKRNKPKQKLKEFDLNKKKLKQNAFSRKKKLNELLKRNDLPKKLLLLKQKDFA